MVPSKPPLVNAKAKANSGCFSCFCMPTVLGSGKNNASAKFVPLEDKKGKKINQIQTAATLEAEE